MEFEWWFKAVVFGQFDATDHSSYEHAKSQSKTWEYSSKRVGDLVKQAELNWKMSDDGLIRIHERMDKLLTTCLAIFGIVVSAMQIGKVQPNICSTAAVLSLVAACILLLISRLPIARYTPTELQKAAAESHLIDDDSDWQFQSAANYHMAQVANDISASVLGYRMVIIITLVVLALLLLTVAIRFPTATALTTHLPLWIRALT